MKSRAARIVRFTATLVAGSAVGWVGHERRDTLSSLLRRTDDGNSRDYGLGRVWSFSETANVKPLVPWDSNWDKRDPNALTKSKKTHPSTKKDVSDETVVQKKPTASRHLLLIRHGQYNVDGATDEKRTLTPLGIQQAELTGQRLAELEFPYTKIIHSTMRRARETASIIHKCLPDIPTSETDLLREGAPYPPEPPLRHWRPDYQAFQDGARIEAAFRKYIHRANSDQTEDSYEIIVCHANVIRYIVCRALQLPPEAWLRLSLKHGSVTLLTVRPNGHVILRSFGDAGYMPPQAVTVL